MCGDYQREPLKPCFLYPGMTGIPLPKVVQLVFFTGRSFPFYSYSCPQQSHSVSWNYLLSSSLLLPIIFLHIFCRVFIGISSSVIKYDQFFAKQFLLHFCLQPSSKQSGQNIIINFFLKRLTQLYVHLNSKCQALCNFTDVI